MTVTSIDKTILAAQIAIEPGYGWAIYAVGSAEVYFKGYLFDGLQTLTGQAAAHHIVARLPAGMASGDMDAALRGFAGHFAFVCRQGKQVVASVDRIASSPLLYGLQDDAVVIDDRGRRLRDTLGLGRRDILSDQAISVALSGWTVGGATLYRGLRQLRAGEALVVNSTGLHVRRWFTYDAWRTNPDGDPVRTLSELHRFLIERLAASAAGRQICVPLSAGLDSRMIASGLRAVGYKNVKLFAYGRPGNHEATASRAIAERLAYPWTFVPFCDSDWRNLAKDKEHALLWDAFDDCSSVPFEQDWLAISRLRRSGYIADDALIVNGQSGDYLSGNHIPVALFGDREPLPVAWPDFVAAFRRKHASLWVGLSSDGAANVLEKLWRDELKQAGYDLDGMEQAYGAFEFLEYQDRQAKYVVSGQRTYDALGLEWRLPLWDDELIEFWRRQPLQLKAGQNLYRRVLERDNWGGVWQGVNYPRYITPRWLLPLRLVLKAGFMALGREAWHRFERRFLLPIIDPLRISAWVPYHQQVLDRRGARHIVAWLTAQYLAQHDLALPDSPGDLVKQGWPS